MNRFKLVSKFKPAGDQPKAIQQLLKGLKNQLQHQVLLGVTGSGKTFTMANVITQINKPTLVIAHNKVLAAQLYAEFKSFFPENAVEYFISYYDYYQPEAYMPTTDIYIEKDASINQHIERLRLKATSSLLERRDVIVVASVSCIYGLGNPRDFKQMGIEIIRGHTKPREVLLTELVNSQYERNDTEFIQGKFRVRGDSVEIFPPYLDHSIKINFFGDEVENITAFNPLTMERLGEKEKIFLYPAKHFVTPRPTIEIAIKEIEKELKERVEFFQNKKKFIEAQRISQRTKYDMEMLSEMGYCHGIENYSRYLSGRFPGERPACLIDYFGDDFLLFIDESHATIPQIRGMYNGDRSRKEVLVEYGFRLPSALDNRPLKFPEFESLIKQVIYVSATPGEYEILKAKTNYKLKGITIDTTSRMYDCVVEQIIRPTGLVDPPVIIKPTETQIQNLIEEIKNATKKKQRVLVNTITKRLAEDLAAYLEEKKIRVRYLHSEIDPLDRIAILQDLRKGSFDVLVGVNLLREGLDLPEVSLVAILDADKEGFLRSQTTLIQIAGRAARNIEGRVILYASEITDSMKDALDEMARRRKIQLDYNKKNNILPKSIVKEVHKLEEFEYKARKDGLQLVSEDGLEYASKKNIPQLLKDLERQMKEAADALDFEVAAIIRDKIFSIKEMLAVKTNLSRVKR